MRVTTDKFRMDHKDQVAQKVPSSSSDLFGSPIENFGKRKQTKGYPSRAKRGPTRQRVHKNVPTLKVSIPKMADKPSGDNI